MTDLQEHVLMLLKEIDKICRENDIEYYLAAGTALGAIRHRGFIPWDDDADIYMTNENWKKFYAVRNQMPEGRELITVEENFDAEYTINRYADISTMRLYRYLCASPQDAGIIVDILVLDPVPDDPEKIRDHIINLTDYTNILTKATSHTQRCPYPLHYKEHLEACETEGREKVLERLKKKATETYEDTKGGVLIQRDAIVPHVWKEEIFGKPQYVPFEDTELPVPAHPYLHLCEAFNEDWMYVPSGKGRARHRKGYNLHISNNNAFEDYRSLVDMDEVEDLYEKRQRYGNEVGLINKAQTEARLQFSETALIYYYEHHELSLPEVEELLKQQDFEALDEYFAQYQLVQNNKSLIGGVAVNGWLRSRAPFYVHISDDFLYLYMRYSMHSQNVFGKLNRILEGREAAFEPTEKIIEIRTLIDSVKEACCMIERKEYREARAFTEPLLEKYPENLLLKRLVYATRYYMGTESEIEAMYAELKELAESTSEVIFNEEEEIDELFIDMDKVLLAILADMEMKKGNREQALVYYEVTARTSDHGLVLLRICDVMSELQDNEEAYEIYRTAARGMGVFFDDEEEDEEEAAETEQNSENGQPQAQDGEGKPAGQSAEDENKNAASVENTDADELLEDETDPDEEEFELISRHVEELTPHQEVLLTLMHEIDEICRDNDIHYYFHGNTALAALRSGGFEEKMVNLNIMMDSVNVHKFIAACEKLEREDRYLESMLNNGDFPTTFIFYGDRNTLDFTTGNWNVYKHHGIHVSIQILRNKERTKLMLKRNAFLEEAWRVRELPQANKSWKLKLYHMVNDYYERKGRDEIGKKLFKLFTKEKRSARRRYFLKTPQKRKRTYFEPEIFSGTEYIPFEDMMVPVPADPQIYLRAHLGKNWMTKKTDKGVNPTIRLIYTDVPYEEFFKELDRRDVDLDSIWKLRRYYLAEARKFETVTKKVHKIWDRLFFVGDRINLWEEYMPRKDELKALYDNQDWGTLLEELDDYLQLAQEYNKKGLGLCFDKDIFGYLEAAMINNEEDEELGKLAEKIRKKVPEQHWEPIRIKTYDGKWVDEQ